MNKNKKYFKRELRTRSSKEYSDEDTGELPPLCDDAIA